MKKPPGGRQRGGEMVSDIEYLEQTIKRLVEELKQKNCISQEFEFLTNAEREIRLEEFIDSAVRSIHIPREGGGR